MNTKTVLLFTLILSVSNIALGMERNTQYQTEQEMVFEHHMTQLSTPIAEFVKDFENWPKEDQDKMTIYCGGYILKPGTAAARNPKYNGNIGRYLDNQLNCNQLNCDQIEPFLLAIDYLKTKK